MNKPIRTTLLDATLTLAPLSAGALDRDVCLEIAASQRGYAEMRDQGIPLQNAQTLQKALNQKYRFPPEVAKALLKLIEATYRTSLSPNAVEILNYTLCIEEP